MVRMRSASSSLTLPPRRLRFQGVMRLGRPDGVVAGGAVEGDGGSVAIAAWAGVSTATASFSSSVLDTLGLASFGLTTRIGAGGLVQGFGCWIIGSFNAGGSISRGR